MGSFMPTLSCRFFKETWRIAKGFWQSEERWYARLLLAVIIGLQLLDVYVLVRYNVWQNGFYNTIQKLDVPGFFSALVFWPVFTLSFLVIEINRLYLQQLLEMKWRFWLTTWYLQTWLNNRTYYFMQVFDNPVDNPDQRISEDLRLFVSYSLELSLGLVKAVVTLCSFSLVLWELSGVVDVTVGTQQISVHGYMVWLAVGYAAAGSWLTAVVGRPLIGLNYAQQQYEADFRFSLMRLRENGEGIASYHGEAQEKTNFMQRFQIVLGNFRKLMRFQKKLSWLTLLHWRLSFLFPYLIAVPRIFSGQLQLGGLFQTATAFTQVELALSFFIKNYYSMTEASLAGLQAVVNRLNGFLDTMEQLQRVGAHKTVVIQYVAEPTISVAGLDIKLPNGEVLISKLDLQIQSGDTLLITGASGCGKSTLLKTLVGIWPFGQGKIRLPDRQSLLFLPQKPYLPIGTLREALTYPDSGLANTDERIYEVMLMCQLGHLAGQLAQRENWSQILSLGEQQRIAFARAILQRPQWLLLDEATSALDEPTEQAMYLLLQQELSGVTMISVGHRSTLTEFHQRQLRIEQAGNWRLAA